MERGTVRVKCLVCQNSFTFVMSVGPSSCPSLAIEITQTIVVIHWIQNMPKYVQYNASRLLCILQYWNITDRININIFWYVGDAENFV